MGDEFGTDHGAWLGESTGRMLSAAEVDHAMPPERRS